MRSLGPALGLLWLAACSGSKQPEAGTTTREAPEPVVTLPEVTIKLGSRPGLLGRSPSMEADLIPVEVPEVRIDRTLARGPDGRPLLAKTRDEAAAFCSAREARLCHEVEWERACAGDAGRTYATGATFQACTSGACPTPEGVETLGLTFAEWTASEVAVGGGQQRAIVRGAAGPGALEHRCAARRLERTDAIDPGLAFRCCHGDAPSLSYPMEGERPVFEPVELTEAAARDALAAVPELASLAADFRYGRPEELRAARERALERTPPINIPESRIVQAAIRFTPARGESALVLAGRSGAHRLVAVLLPSADGGFHHGASLVMRDEPSTVVLFRRDEGTKELGFSTCLGCGGEDGEVRFRDDGRFVVVTR